MMKTRQDLVALLGDRPPIDRAISVISREVEGRDTHRLEKLTLDLNGVEPVPAYLAIPKNASRPPVVLYNHSHGGFYDVGKDELLRGAPYLQSAYLEPLISLGYAVLAIDHWGFGRRHTRSERSIFKQMLWDGQVMWGMMLYDSQRAIDYLFSRDDLDANRLTTLGMSMGGTMAIWISAIDERVTRCIDLCGSADFDELVTTDGIEGHGVYFFVPSLRKHFSAGELQALIAPRERWSFVGLRDPLTRGTNEIDAYLRVAYAKQGAAGAWHYHPFDVGHVETPQMRTTIINVLASQFVARATSP